ncbi:MAG: hypothetical protein NTX76_03455 [Alphaproteobacteria bacterium]|nr:hypothetical protein [Alphaproteobacteria bacterium]
MTLNPNRLLTVALVGSALSIGMGVGGGETQAASLETDSAWGANKAAIVSLQLAAQSVQCDFLRITRDSNLTTAAEVYDNDPTDTNKNAFEAEIKRANAIVKMGSEMSNADKKARASFNAARLTLDQIYIEIDIFQKKAAEAETQKDKEVFGGKAEVWVRYRTEHLQTMEYNKGPFIGYYMAIGEDPGNDPTLTKLARDIANENERVAAFGGIPIQRS